MVSGVIIAFIAFGLPVVFAIVLVRAASHYKRDQVRTDNFLVRAFPTASPLGLALSLPLQLGRPLTAAAVAGEARGQGDGRGEGDSCMGDTGRDDWQGLCVSHLLALAQIIPWQSACLNYLCATDSFLMDAFDPKYLYW